uniref:Uncharacterized protein n=1 Tax=Arundo donax TaxID=35708 RepID=A0A0A9BDR5_ARUDO
MIYAYLFIFTIDLDTVLLLPS